MTYLCDTNIISEVMRRRPNETVKQWLGQREKIYLSVITVEEIYYGLAYRDAQKQLEWFKRLLQFRADVLPITTAIAQQCGLWRGQFRRQGITRSQADLLIAATADAHNLILVTRNTKDFAECDIQLFDPFTEIG